MKLFLAALLIAVPLSLPLLSADSPVPRFTDAQRRARLKAALPRIEPLFERFYRERGVPGLVYGLVIDGDVIGVKSFGVRERGANEPVTAQTVFRIASMTKSFAALAILKLRDEGKLSLEDPVAKFVPEFAQTDYPTRDTAPLRVRQLLTHSAGFPEDNPWGDRQLDAPHAVMTGWLEKGIPFSTPPDTAYEYSNYGFALLGRIVAAASGRPFREYLESEFLAPLGMTASTMEPSAVPEAKRAQGYRREDGGYAEEPSLADGAFGAMGGLLTSAEDLGRYVAFQLSAYPPRDDADAGPVRRSSVREMQQLWRYSNLVAARNEPGGRLRVQAGGYGYGLRITHDCRFGHMVAHGGGLPGFGSYMLWLPEHGVGFFAMANLTYSSPAPAILEALEVLDKTGALKRRELPVAPVLTRTRDAIFALWQNWSDEGADRLAADNLFLDRPKETRRKAMEAMKAEMGVCRLEGEIRPENLLRGEFRMGCEKGFVEVSFTLAPIQPPLVQHLEFRSVKPLNGAMKALAEKVAALSSSPADKAIRSIASAELNVATLRRDMEALRVSRGACRVGETISGDGVKSAGVRLECERGAVDAYLQADGQGKLRRVSFRNPPQSPCEP